MRRGASRSNGNSDEAGIGGQQHQAADRFFLVLRQLHLKLMYELSTIAVLFERRGYQTPAFRNAGV